MVLSTIGRALAELADSWTLLILQRAFLGVRRFAGWRDELGISESVLSGRLRDMTAAGLLEARPYREGGRTRSEYWLTPRGLDLWTLLVAIWSWEREWVPREVPLPDLWHDGNHMCDIALVCGTCGEVVTARDTTTEQLLPSFAGSLPRVHPRRSRKEPGADTATSCCSTAAGARTAGCECERCNPLCNAAAQADVGRTNHYPDGDREASVECLRRPGQTSSSAAEPRHQFSRCDATRRSVDD